MNRRFVSLLLMIAMVLSYACFTAASAEQEVMTVTFLNCWHGEVGDWTEEEMQNNVCAQYIKEKFGIQMIMAECPQGDEAEYLNMVIASGVMPDMINNAYWGDYAGGSGAIIIDAASQGLVKDLSSYLPDYENLNALYGQGVSAAVSKALINNANYNGGQYFIPGGINFDGDEYSTVYGDTLYARADVLEAVGVNAEDVTNLDELYDLLNKIKEAGLKDFNGNNDLIPISTGAQGWRQQNFYEWNHGNNISNFRLQEDGTVKYWLFTDEPELRVNYMRKLISEGLMDVECFSRNDEDLYAKLAQGSFGVLAIDASAAVNWYYDADKQNQREGTEWVPLNLTNKDGNNCVDVFQPGWTGGGVTWFSADIDETKLRALLSLADWFCTEEGYTFNKYGIEGVTFEYVDGIPTILPEIQEKVDAGEADLEKDYGVRQWNELCMPSMDNKYWTIPDSEYSEQELALRDMRNHFRPRVEVNALSVDDLLKGWDGYDNFVDAISTIDANTYLNRAYYYTSDEEVTQLIEDLRNRFIEAGVEEACQYIQDNLTDEYAF